METSTRSPLADLEHPGWVYVLWAAVHFLTFGGTVLLLTTRADDLLEAVGSCFALFAALCLVAVAVTTGGLALRNAYGPVRAVRTAVSMPASSVSTLLSIATGR